MFPNSHEASLRYYEIQGAGVIYGMINTVFSAKVIDNINDIIA